jgi:hypothetical protein
MQFYLAQTPGGALRRTGIAGIDKEFGSRLVQNFFVGVSKLPGFDRH